MREEATNETEVWYGYCINILNTLSEVMDFRYVGPLIQAHVVYV